MFRHNWRERAIDVQTEGTNAVCCHSNRRGLQPRLELLLQQGGWEKLMSGIALFSTSKEDYLQWCTGEAVQFYPPSSRY